MYNLLIFTSHTSHISDEVMNQYIVYTGSGIGKDNRKMELPVIQHTYSDIIIQCFMGEKQMPFCQFFCYNLYYIDVINVKLLNVLMFAGLIF